MPFDFAVVLDDPLAYTLLALGAKEGLVESDDNDRIFATLCEEYADSSYIEQVLEQVVLCPKLLTTAPGIPWKHLKGPLIGKVLNEAPTPTKPAISVDASHFPIIEEMLRARGHHIPASEFFNVLNVAVEAGKEALSFGRPLPDTLEAIGEETKVFIETGQKGTTYSEDDWAKTKRWRAAISAAQDITSCSEKYEMLATVSRSKNALLRIPLKAERDTDTLFPALQLDRRESLIGLYEITATSLGVLPYGATLKDSLDMAHRLETQALRTKLIEWARILGAETPILHKPMTDAQRLDGTALISEEINEAASVLFRASKTEPAGRWSTYIGIPLGLAGFIPPIGVIASALGMTTSLVGVYAQRTKDKTVEDYKWVMFANRF